MRLEQIDYSNWGQLIDLMNNADRYPTKLLGHTADGEFITTSIEPDVITARILQDNGVTRVVSYYRDHTVEESYEFGGRDERSTDPDASDTPKVDLSSVPDQDLIDELVKRGYEGYCE